LVNGTPVRFVVDTGASQVVLTQKDAENAGIALADLVYSGRANTANGRVRIAPVRLDSIDVDGVEMRNIRASVNEGQMGTSLLGMTYLERFSRIEIAGGALVLHR
jgi:aspartyl protease family protein